MGQMEDLRAFVRIVETESIGKAAEQAGIAKSAMSRKLRLLEERLKTELITRTTRQWALTAAGRAYFAHAQTIIAEVDEADAEITNEEVDISGELRLSAPLHYGTRSLAEHLMGFAEMYSGIQLFVDFNDRFVDIIGEHYDLAIRISNLQDSSMIARKLTTTRHVFCASPDYVRETQEITRPEDLKSHRILQIGQTKRFKVGIFRARRRWAQRRAQFLVQLEQWRHAALRCHAWPRHRPFAGFPGLGCNPLGPVDKDSGRMGASSDAG